MELLDMNYDCLEHIFRFLDLKSVCSISDTCKHLSGIAEGIFKKHINYKCHIGDEKRVREASKIIQKIGQHVNALQLNFVAIDTEVYMTNGIGCKFLSLLNRSLGEKFRELELVGYIGAFPVLRLTPTFLKLEKLSIYYLPTDDENNATVYIDLPQLCPNLRVLSIDDCAVIFAPNPIKSFRSLEVLEFHGYGAYYPIDTFECFIRKNEYFKRLYADNSIDSYGDRYDRYVVTANLNDLEELQTYVFENWVPAIRNLSELHLVCSERVDTFDEINEILDILKTMTQLKKLWIGWRLRDYFPNQQAIVNIVKELKQLESFQVDLKCDWDTIVECIRFGHSLQRFSVKLGTDRVVTSTFIKRLAKVRESVADGSRQPLLLHFHGAVLNGDVLKVLEEPGVKQYLKWKYLHFFIDKFLERTYNCFD